MGFHSYFVQLSHPESSILCNVVADGKNHRVNLKKIEGDLFLVFFKSQVGLRQHQKVNLGRKKEGFTVLLPVLSKYNQRRIKKIIGFQKILAESDFAGIVPQVLGVEKFVEMDRLRDFFKLDTGQMIDRLLQMEISSQIKIIDFRHLGVTSYEHYRWALTELQAALKQYLEKREKSVPFTQIEKAVKIPQSTIFFRYLLKLLAPLLSYKILKSSIVFEKLPPSAEEKNHIDLILKSLRKNRLIIFSIENIIKITGLSYGQVNDSLWFLFDDEQIVQIDSNHFMFADELGKMINRLKKFKRNQGEWIDIAGLREMTGLSRQYIIILLEYFDAVHLTRRRGNLRQILVGV